MNALFVLFAQNPTHPDGVDLVYLKSEDTYSALGPKMESLEKDLNPGEFLVVARFTGEKAETLQTLIQDLENGDYEGDQLELIETTLLDFLFPLPDGFDDSMDGDHESALASAGFGTDEDYGRFNGDDE